MLTDLAKVQAFPFSPETCRGCTRYRAAGPRTLADTRGTVAVLTAGESGAAGAFGLVALGELGQVAGFDVVALPNPRG